MITITATAMIDIVYDAQLFVLLLVTLYTLSLLKLWA